MKFPISNLTPRSQQVLALARKEAFRLKHNYLDTAHILLGILKIETGVAPSILNGYNIDINNTRLKVEHLLPPSLNKATKNEIPYTEKALAAIKSAQQEAKQFNHTYIGTEHLLLGILNDQKLIEIVFDNKNIRVEDIRNKIISEISGINTNQDPEDAPKHSRTTYSEDKKNDRRDVQTHLGNDGYSSDSLNRSGIARIIASFLKDKRTQAPLTISIEGCWGSGKTNFMKLLRAELGNPRSDQNSLKSVWFNPWRHQSHEELWAAFALTVLNSLRSQITWKSRFVADLKIAWLCLDRQKFGWSACGIFIKLALLSAAFLFFFFFMEAGWNPEQVIVKFKEPETWRLFFGIKETTASLAISFTAVSIWFWSKFNAYLPKRLAIHIERPNYDEKTNFLEKFHKDFALAIKVYSNRPIIVFIDDLDRCDVPRAAELMQGINLMLGDEAKLIYILGIDRAKVAAGIAVKNSELLPFLYANDPDPGNEEALNHKLRIRGLEYGYEFLEKFIQIPFRLPPSGPDELRTFISSRLTVPEAKNMIGIPLNTSKENSSSRKDTVAAASLNEAILESVAADESHLEQPLLHASRILGGNPRRVAQLINLVRLQRRLAPALLPDNLNQILKDGHLAKWTAVALRWPTFIQDISDEPKLLVKIIISDINSSSNRAKHWRMQSELCSFLQDSGPPGANSADYNLSNPNVVDALLRLAISVPIVEVATETRKGV